MTEIQQAHALEVQDASILSSVRRTCDNADVICVCQVMAESDHDGCVSVLVVFDRTSRIITLRAFWCAICALTVTLAIVAGLQPASPLVMVALCCAVLIACNFLISALMRTPVEHDALMRQIAHDLSLGGFQMICSGDTWDIFVTRGTPEA